MTWNKTDDTAADPDQPVSSWLAQRILTNTDDHTRDNRTWVFDIPIQVSPDSKGDDRWMASNTPRPYVCVVPLMPECDEIDVVLSAETRKLLADVEVDVGYGLPRGRTAGWTGYQTFSSGPGVVDEASFTLDLSEAHLAQLREIPILIRIHSLESTDPADIDINGGYPVYAPYTPLGGGASIAPDIQKWWTVIEDGTTLDAAYNPDDAFSFTYSGTKYEAGKPPAPFTDENYGFVDQMIHYRTEEEGDHRALHVWPHQDSTTAAGTLFGALDIHLTLLGAIRFHSITITQKTPLSFLPYPGVNPTPLARLQDAYQAVAPDMPTRYQTDLLTHRAQKYLVANRPPVSSIGPTGSRVPPIASTVADSDPAIVQTAGRMMLIPLDQTPTQVSLGSGLRERKAIDATFFFTGWANFDRNSLAEMDLRLELLEIDTTQLLVPSYQPAYIVNHVENIPISPTIQTDPDGWIRRIKTFPGTRTFTNFSVYDSPLQALWPRWSDCLRSLTRVEVTIVDPTPGQVHDYLRVSLYKRSGSLLDNRGALQCVGWYINEARGQAWETTTEAL